MLKVGITGGIGSGKSTVTQIFSMLKIPIFIADIEARRLMNEDEQLKSALIALLGPEIYDGSGMLNRPLMGERIFNHPELLQQVNALVHPASEKAFEEWVAAQTSPYVLKEAAILFESGTWKGLDYIITVTAPEKLRIARAMKRDGSSEEQVKARIKNQWTDEAKISRSHFVIYNDETQSVIQQVLNINGNLLKV